jgi:hypothetical protein
VKGNEEIGTFDFAILGRFNYQQENFSQLSFLLNGDGNVINAETVKDCGWGATIKFPDGSDHVSVNFSRVDDGFISNNAECLLGALTGEEAAIVKFLTSNFVDIAVGMVSDGTADIVRHDGIKTFVNRVAKGEITVGM